MPGAWGRYKGLPVRADSVATLQQMGIKLIRQGGSFEKNRFLPWKKWRGPIVDRVSEVYGNWGHGLVSGWGSFEFIDMCNAMGIEPVMDTTNVDPQDFADLVEYCWAGKDTTWGALRIADGHPDPYRVKYF
eukprot:gene4424-9407_t